VSAIVIPDLAGEIQSHRDPRMVVNDRLGYLDLVPGEIDGFEAMRASCLAILAERRAGLDARGSKKAYLRPLLEANDFLEHPEIVEYCLDPKLLATAADYLGEPAVLRTVQLFLTPANETESGSQRWHYDHIPPRQLKLFVYLTPVAEDNGPFTFVPAEISEAFMASRGTTWDEANRKTYTDEEVSTSCGTTAIRRLLGPAGAGGMVDTTRCLHYGGRARRGERTMMIIQYTRRGAPKDGPSVPPRVPHPDRLSHLQRAALQAA
jgi:hypothetical protein